MRLLSLVGEPIAHALLVIIHANAEDLLGVGNRRAELDRRHSEQAATSLRVLPRTSEAQLENLAHGHSASWLAVSDVCCSEVAHVGVLAFGRIERHEHSRLEESSLVEGDQPHVQSVAR